MHQSEDTKERKQVKYWKSLEIMVGQAHVLCSGCFLSLIIYKYKAITRLLHPEYWSYSFDMNSTGVRDISVTQHRQQEGPKPKKQHSDIQALNKQKEFDFQLNSAGLGWTQNDLSRQGRHINPSMAPALCCLPIPFLHVWGGPDLGCRCSSSGRGKDEMGDALRDALGQILGKSFQ